MSLATCGQRGAPSQYINRRSISALRNPDTTTLDRNDAGEEMFLASLLFVECDPDTFTDLPPQQITGRLVVARELYRGVLRDERISEAIVWSHRTNHETPFGGKCRIGCGNDEWNALRTKCEMVWYEPMRHYTFYPAYMRRLLQRHFPIVTHMHGLAYSHEIPVTAASLSLGSAPGDAILCPTQSAGRAMARYLDSLNQLLESSCRPPELIVLDYPVRSPILMPRVVAKQALGLSATCTAMLYLGRLDAPDKGDLCSLLQAFRHTKDSATAELHLVVAGSSESEGPIRAITAMANALHISESVTVLPNFPEPLKATLYSAADVFIAPSITLNESFGLTVVEAMASGAAVVCSDWDGYRESVTDGVTGLRVPTVAVANLPEELDRAAPLGARLSVLCADSIALDGRGLCNALQALCSPELRARLGRRAQREAVARWDVDRCTKKVVDVLESRLKVQSSPPVTEYGTSLFASFSHYVTRWLGSHSRLGRTTISVADAVAAIGPQAMGQALQVLAKPERAASTPATLLVRLIAAGGLTVEEDNH